jgi:pilus assembly protein CpaE
MAELRKSYDYVVVDTSCHLSEFNLEVIEMAQRILVMTTLTIPAIKDAKLALKVLESLNVDSGSILLIVNQSDGHSDFNRESIEQNLRHPVSAQLPFEAKIVSESVTRGTPFVTLNPDAGISRAVRDLVDLVAPQEAALGTAADKKKRKGLFSR